MIFNVKLFNLLAFITKENIYFHYLLLFKCCVCNFSDYRAHRLINYFFHTFDSMKCIEILILIFSSFFVFFSFHWICKSSDRSIGKYKSRYFIIEDVFWIQITTNILNNAMFYAFDISIHSLFLFLFFVFGLNESLTTVECSFR